MSQRIMTDSRQTHMSSADSRAYMMSLQCHPTREKFLTSNKLTTTMIIVQNKRKIACSCTTLTKNVLVGTAFYSLALQYFIQIQ